jgi:serine/threonine protein kinase
MSDILYVSNSCVEKFTNDMSSTSVSTSEEYNNNIVIANEYVLGRLISSGGFGSVHYGFSLHTHKVVAIKLENTNTIKHEYLKNEYEIMRELNTPIDGFNMTGIPKIYWFGKQDDYTVMVMDLLGMNIEMLNVSIDKVIKQQHTLEKTLVPTETINTNTNTNTKTLPYMNKLKYILVLKIAFKLLVIIENLHKQGYIHKDIKPHNILINNDYNVKQGLISSHPPEIYIIDFGLTEKLYTDDGEHITKRRTGKFTGTVKYMSRNTHDGIQQSRADDLESFMYFVLHLLNIKLPWSDVIINQPKQQSPNGDEETEKQQILRKKERILKVKEIKLNVDYVELCKKHNVPDELFDDIVKLTEYVRGLSFYSIPDYFYMKKLLSDAHLRLTSTF